MIAVEQTSVNPAPARAPRRPGRRAALIVAVALAALTALVAYLYLGAPGLVRTEILKTIAQRYHRTARLDRVSLDPLRLVAEADGFSLPDRDGRPMVAFQRVKARLDWPSLLIGKIAFTRLSLEAPQVRLVRRPDGRVNLADLIPPPDASKPKGKPLAVRIALFQLAGGSIELVDAMRPAPFEKRFDQIAFSLKDFATTTDGATYTLAAQSAAGEQLSWRGTLGVAPLASRGRFDFAGWRADRLAALAPPGVLPFTVSSGWLDAHGTYDVALRGRALDLKVDLDQAALKSAEIRPSHGGAGPIRAEALTVSGAHLDLGQRAVSAAHVVLTRPQVAAWRDRSGAVNLAAYVPKPQAHAAPAAPASRPGWTISAPDVRIEKGKGSFEDRAAHRTVAWALDPIDLAVTGFAYPFAGPLQVALHAETNDGSTLQAKGDLTLPNADKRLSAGFDVALDGLELNRFQAYIDQAARVSIANGEAGVKGRLDLAPDGGVRFKGALSVDDLRVVDPTLKANLVTWDRVEATGIEAASKPFAVKVARVLAQHAYGSVVLEPNYVFNIRAVLDQSDTGAGVSPATTAPVPTPVKAVRKTRRPAVRPAPAKPSTPIDLPIDIDRIDVVDGRMDFTDMTVNPRFAAGIQSLGGDITGFSARAGKRATVDLKGGVDPFAPVTITGSLEPFATDRYLDLAMAFHNIELTTFTPYSGKFAGYRIDKGKLDLDLRYQIADEKLNATHHVVINQLQLGDKVDSADATHLPVKLIIALLKDRNGVIDLPIDVSGSLDDPKFKIWPVIWKVVDNLLGKIAAAPFTLLGHLVGNGADETLGQIAFQPGSAALAPAEAGKLATLANALNQRPALSLEIPETVAPSLDGPALADAAYQDALQAAYRETFKRGGAADLAQALATPKLKRRLLETAYRQAFGQKPPPPGNAESSVKDPDARAADALETVLRSRLAASARALQDLAQARAQAVETALAQAGHVEPKRIFVVAAPPLTTGPIVMTVALR